MAVAVTRLELDASDLRRAATRCRDAKAARRMLALALVLTWGVGGQAVFSRSFWLSPVMMVVVGTAGARSRA